MALTPDLVRQTITAPGTTSIWDDETVYGGLNPNRNQVALFLTAYKVDEDLVETALDVTTFDPEVVTSFTTTNDIDGWHKYYFVIVDNWDAGTTYNKHDVVWDTTEDAFFKYINDTPADTNPVSDINYWEPVADPCTLIANVGTDEESGNLIYQVINKIVSFQTSICYIKAASRHAKLNCGGADCGCGSKIGRLFHKLRDLFNSLPLNESQGQFLEGERNARLAQKWCDDCEHLQE